MKKLSSIAGLRMFSFGTRICECIDRHQCLIQLRHGRFSVFDEDGEKSSIDEAFGVPEAASVRTSWLSDLAQVIR